MPPKLNAEWHAKHPMPTHPSLDQRLEWHLAHARHCSCRPLSGQILQAAKKRYAGTHQEFWVYFTRNDHFVLAGWAAACAEHVLPLFEEHFPLDTRPRKALYTLREWISSGEFHLQVIKSASLAAHAAARAVQVADPAACYAARAAGQAVATAHVPTHGLGPALYAIKAVAAAHPDDMLVVVEQERAWQLSCLPANLREWVISELKKRQNILPPRLRFLFIT